MSTRTSTLEPIVDPRPVEQRSGDRQNSARTRLMAVAAAVSALAAVAIAVLGVIALAP